MSESLTGEFFPDNEIDPMLEAIRQAIVDAGAGAPPEGWTAERWAGLDAFGEKQVVIIAPDETDQGIDAAIKNAMARSIGLALLLVSGSGKNPDADAPGPLVTLELEAQLFVSTRIRGNRARPALGLLADIAKLLHLARISEATFQLYETIRFQGFDPLPDPEFTAFALRFEREMQF